MQLDRLTGIEKWRELKIARWSYRGAIERCPQQFDLDGSRSYQEFIKHIETSSMDQVAVEKLSRLILKNLEIESQESRWIEFMITAIKKRSSRGSIDTLVVKRYREAVKIA